MIAIVIGLLCICLSLYYQQLFFSKLGIGIYVIFVNIAVLSHLKPVPAFIALRIIASLALLNALVFGLALFWIIAMVAHLVLAARYFRKALPKAVRLYIKRYGDISRGVGNHSDSIKRNASV